MRCMVNLAGSADSSRTIKQSPRFASSRLPGEEDSGKDAFSTSRLLRPRDVPGNLPPLAYRLFSPYRRVDWSKLTDDPHHRANQRAIYALVTDLRDRKGLFKVHKSAHFKAAVLQVNESVSWGTVRTAALQAAEEQFLQAVEEFPFHSLKAEAYQAAGVVAKALGDPQQRAARYLEQARHHYEASEGEIQELLHQNELHWLDKARLLVGIVPIITEWLFRLDPNTNPSLKPNQTFMARVLTPVSKLTNRFNAEEMLNHRQNSDIPELCRRLT